jgi:hypothetical protein
MPRRTTKRKKSDSSIPLEAPKENTSSEPVQPEETQGLPEESREESVSVDYNESDVDEPSPHRQGLWNPLIQLPHLSREGGRRTRSRICSVTTSMKGLTHFYGGTNARDSDRSRRMKRKRRRTLKSTSRVRFIRTPKRRITRSA